MLEIKEKLKQNSWLTLGKAINKSIAKAGGAFKEAGLDFRVDKKQLGVILSDKDTIVIPNQYATVRMDTKKILGIVGSRYTILQNVDAFTYFDYFIEKGIAEYESVGIFGKGERVFINANLKTPIIVTNGNDSEEILLNIFMTNSHDATGGSTLLINPVRVLTNTSLNGSLPGKGNSNRIIFRHTAGVHENIQYTEQIQDRIMLYQTKLGEIFNKMATTPVDEKTSEKIIVNTLADNEGMVLDYYSTSPSQRFVTIVERVINFDLYNETQNTPLTNNTVFGLYNSISAYYQLEHEWKSEDEKAHQILTNGARLTKRTQTCFDECLKLIK